MKKSNKQATVSSSASTEPANVPSALAITGGAFDGISVNENCTGLTFTEDIPFETWAEAGVRIGQIGRINGFALGDWINHGRTKILINLTNAKVDAKKREGEDATQWTDRIGREQAAVKEAFDAALKATGMEMQSLNNLASVASKYPAAERIHCITGMVSFTIYQELAYVKDVNKRRELIERAAKEGLSAKEIRLLKAGKPLPNPSAPAAPEANASSAPTEPPQYTQNAKPIAGAENDAVNAAAGAGTPNPAGKPEAMSDAVNREAQEALKRRVSTYVRWCDEIRDFLIKLGNNNLLAQFYGPLVHHDEDWKDIFARVDAAKDFQDEEAARAVNNQ